MWIGQLKRILESDANSDIRKYMWPSISSAKRSVINTDDNSGGMWSPCRGLDGENSGQRRTDDQTAIIWYAPAVWRSG
jgi:hypothetical protein